MKVILFSQSASNTSATEEIFKCEYNGKTYIEGQKFEVEEPCKSCICQKGFDGKYFNVHLEWEDHQRAIPMVEQCRFVAVCS